MDPMEGWEWDFDEPRKGSLALWVAARRVGPKTDRGQMMEVGPAVRLLKHPWDGPEYKYQPYTHLNRQFLAAIGTGTVRTHLHPVKTLEEAKTKAIQLWEFTRQMADWVTREP